MGCSRSPESLSVEGYGNGNAASLPSKKTLTGI